MLKEGQKCSSTFLLKGGEKVRYRHRDDSGRMVIRGKAAPSQLYTEKIIESEQDGLDFDWFSFRQIFIDCQIFENGKWYHLDFNLRVGLDLNGNTHDQAIAYMKKFTRFDNYSEKELEEYYINAKLTEKKEVKQKNEK